jgi:hypothetical protein
MIGKSFVIRLATGWSRRGLMTAIVYGLSLSVRFTSATGEEVEIPLSAERAHPLISIMIRDGSRLPYQDWSPKFVQPIFLRHGWRSKASPPDCIAP